MRVLSNGSTPVLSLLFANPIYIIYLFVFCLFSKLQSEFALPFYNPLAVLRETRPLER